MVGSFEGCCVEMVSGAWSCQGQRFDGHFWVEVEVDHSVEVVEVGHFVEVVEVGHLVEN